MGVSGNGRAGRLWRRLLALFVLAATAGLFALVVWRAATMERGGTEFAEVPLIRAPQSAARGRPEVPGGMAVPYQDTLIYESLEPGARPPVVESLLPPPEEPLAPPRAVAAAPARDRAEPDRRANDSPAARSAASVKPAQSPPPVPFDEMIAALTEPKGDGAATKPIASPAPPVAAVDSGYRVQLASFRARAAAERGWARIKARAPALLGAFSPLVEAVDLGKGQGVFYRLQAGPIADRGAATDLCRSLRARKLDCLVVGP